MDIALYQSVSVFRRLQTEVVLYRCFKKLPNEGYVVQSADRLRIPLRQEDLHQLTSQFIELLIEEAPESRGPLCSTIEEAIAAFDRLFE